MALDDNARYVLFVNRGVLRVRTDRIDDAIADLKAAIELKPNAYQAYVNLAQAYRRHGQARPGPRTIASRRPARAGSGPPLPPASAALPGTRRAGSRLPPSTGRSSARTRIAPTRSTTRSNAAGCSCAAAKDAEALASFDAALALRKDHSLASAFGPRRCSGWADLRRSSRRSTATWRRGSRSSRSIAAADWRGPSWASTRARSRISRRRSSCTRPRPCRRIGAGLIWWSIRRSWPCATSSWPSSSIPRMPTPTTAGASPAPGWAVTARPCRMPRKPCASGRRRHGCSTTPRGSTRSAPTHSSGALELDPAGVELAPGRRTPGLLDHAHPEGPGACRATSPSVVHQSWKPSSREGTDPCVLDGEPRGLSRSIASPAGHSGCRTATGSNAAPCSPPPLESAAPLHFGLLNDATASHFLSTPGEVDLYSVTLQSGDTIDASIGAQQTGSALTSLLRVFDAERHAAGARQPGGGRPATDLPGRDRRHLLHRRQQRPQRQLQSVVADSGTPAAATGLYTLDVTAHDVGALMPDLTGSSFRTGLDMAAPGDSVPVSFTVQNRGGADPGNFQVQVLLAAEQSASTARRRCWRRSRGRSWSPMRPAETSRRRPASA